MPVEIRELIIRAVALDDRARPVVGERGETDEARKDLVEECVKQVLRVLRKSGER